MASRSRTQPMIVVVCVTLAAACGNNNSSINSTETRQPDPRPAISTTDSPTTSTVPSNVRAESSTTAAPNSTNSTTTISTTNTSTATTSASIDVSPGTRVITYVGALFDQSDLAALGIGTAGHWFAHFDGPSPADNRPTDEHAVANLPDWIGPLNHFSILETGEGCSDDDLAAGCRPGFGFRTFSQDGPARSSGGHAEWSMLTIPGGRVGLSGAIVDAHTAGNTNNTVNRIQLEEGVPAVFYFHVVTDNTAGEHDPTATLRARANFGLIDLNDQVEPDVILDSCGLAFNGIPDIYTFRFDGFAAEDYIKLRLAGTSGGEGASFAGFMFDLTLDESLATSDLPPGQEDNPPCRAGTSTADEVVTREQ